MTAEDFRESLTATEPPAGLTLALAGLWWDAKAIGRRRTSPPSRTKAMIARGFTPTSTAKKAIRATQRIGTAGRASPDTGVSAPTSALIGHGRSIRPRYPTDGRLTSRGLGRAVEPTRTRCVQCSKLYIGNRVTRRVGVAKTTLNG